MSKVFIFWIGDKDKVKPLISNIKNQGLEVHVGPTKSEHKFLYENYKYYKDSFDMGIFSFCSDVWRFYMLSKNDGLYIDSSVEIGKDFGSFVSSLEKEGTTLFKESSNGLASSVLFNKGDRNLFKNALDFYGKYNELEVKSPRVFWIGPLVITRSAFIYGIKAKKNILDIRNKSTIYKSGMNSWSKGDGDKYWQFTENAFKEGKPPYSKRVQNLLENIDSPIDVYGVRDAYDFARDKTELKEIGAIYKKISYNISFSERLVWSKLYRLFKH